MGSLYFVVKNFILTFIIVCVLQIRIGRRSFEDHLNSLIRSSLAPSFLGVSSEESLYNFGIESKDLELLKKKISQNHYVKETKKSAQKMLLKEVQEILKEKTKDSLNVHQDKTEKKNKD